MIKDLSIIILSYNTKEATINCIKSVYKALSNNIKSEVIVIDNASADDSVESLKELQNQKPDLLVVKNEKNAGYTKGNNQGLKIAKGRYILFLNSDTLVDNIDFTKLLSYLDQNHDVGSLTVRVNLPDGRIDPASHRGFPTIWNSFCYFFKLESIFGRIKFLNKYFGGYHLTFNDLKTVHEIDSPSGAFYLTRKEILDKLGGFDEQFFMYGEDLDLSYRIKLLGCKIIYYPLYHITHIKYTSGLENKNKAVIKEVKNHFYDAMKIFYKKHYESKNPSLVNRMVYTFINLKKNL